MTDRNCGQLGPHAPDPVLPERLGTLEGWLLWQCHVAASNPPLHSHLLTGLEQQAAASEQDWSVQRTMGRVSLSISGPRQLLQNHLGSSSKCRLEAGSLGLRLPPL